MTGGLGEPNAAAIACFFLFVASTLGITWWAARRTRGRRWPMRRHAPLPRGMKMRPVPSRPMFPVTKWRRHRPNPQ